MFTGRSQSAAKAGESNQAYGVDGVFNFFGNLTAVWLLPSFGARLLWILLGVSVALPRLLAEQAAHENSPSSSAPAATELAPA